MTVARQQLLCGGVIVLLGFLIELAVSLSLNGGEFTYSLDDAYIHLALAENMSAGHYGVNAQEVSAPSSSIAWPLLLTGLHQLAVPWVYTPIVINVLSAFLLLITWRSILELLFRDVRIQWALLPFPVIGLNLFGLMFTGMEHLLQVLCVLVICRGLLFYSTFKTIPVSLILALIGAPLIRYENMAASCLGCFCLFLMGKRALSAVLIALAIMPVIAFSYYLHEAGMGWFPSSVLAKSDVVSSGSKIASVFTNLLDNSTEKRGRGILFLVSLALIIYGAIRRRKDPAVFIISFFVLGIGVAHLFFGRMGWYSRYEVYAWAVLMFGVLCCFRSNLESWFSKRFIPLKVCMLLTIPFLLSPSYLYATLTTPWACHNIYDQQFQMHRWVTEYWDAPIIANDIGYVSLGNTNYVLDIWGLASYEALQQRDAVDREWINTMADRYNAEMAIVYPHVNLPVNWKIFASMTLSSRRISVADKTVLFYARDADNTAVLNNLSSEFIKSLPSDVIFFKNDDRNAENTLITDGR